ncbi:hypothetical protein CYMTET_2846 [Cymbomonas tetramitiformis]|uniref:Uncharacterized protein n=1 Tax=Cymbomonas tetramitiformis TaxID=36881 RepID=A0AAE0H4E5_9CHLO|nr:hypothetical protein CYMTET_2846 [Cymbomonas tetramitiformis]
MCTLTTANAAALLRTLSIASSDVCRLKIASAIFYCRNRSCDVSIETALAQAYCQAKLFGTCTIEGIRQAVLRFMRSVNAEVSEQDDLGSLIRHFSNCR